MLKRLIAAALILFLIQLGLAHAAPENFFDLAAKAVNGKEVKFNEYRGKTILVVNVASKCGFTPQYEGLEALYKKYRERGFEIFGFPSNDFLSQEPGTNAEIQQFCKLNYGVTFPLFEKNPVIGDSKQPVYKYLVANAPVEKGKEVGWNFEKFLVNSKGEVVGRWRSKVKPESDEIVKSIEANLLTSAKK